MSRQLKFRAWSSEHKEMSAGVDLYALLTKEPLHDFEVHDLVLMQFTGLQDKTGNDIYEGDILACENLYDWLVSYSERGSFIAHDPSDKDSYVFLDDYTFEIIGNIYETPELLAEGE